MPRGVWGLLNMAWSLLKTSFIQKFLPETGRAEYDRLSDRTNIVVIVDEAHRRKRRPGRDAAKGG